MEGAELVPNLQWMMAAQAMSQGLQRRSDPLGSAVAMAERLSQGAIAKRERSDSAAMLDAILAGNADPKDMMSKHPYASKQISGALLQEMLNERSNVRTEDRQEKRQRALFDMQQQGKRADEQAAADRQDLNAQLENQFAAAQTGEADARQGIAASAPFVGAQQRQPSRPMTEALPRSTAPAQDMFALPPQEPAGQSVQPPVTAQDLEAMLNEQIRNKGVMRGPGMAAAGQRAEDRKLVRDTKDAAIQQKEQQVTTALSLAKDRIADNERQLAELDRRGRRDEEYFKIAGQNLELKRELLRLENDPKHQGELSGAKAKAKAAQTSLDKLRDFWRGKDIPADSKAAIQDEMRRLKAAGAQ